MSERQVDGAAAQRDAWARERALDVRHSFLVQAPAGSGKTGLLIQRYLALLAHVDRPERVVAMTFTRKAAAEMRERVLTALREAMAGTAMVAGQPHALVTRRLALAALAQDDRCHWQLLAQPSRMRMLTIDALAASLARQAPVATGLGAMPAFVDDASALYTRAVRAALAAADANDPTWRQFLARIDNDADRAVDLLASLLARRDQWLRLPLGAARSELRADLERALRSEVETVLARTRALFPGNFAARIAASARYAAAYFSTIAGAGDHAESLALLVVRDGVPLAVPDALESWRVLADFLLTQSDQTPAFRIQIDGRNGFPAKGNETGCAERVAAKRAMKELLNDARRVPGLAQALAAVRILPSPTYGDGAWAFVDATLLLMRQIAGRLLTVFAAEGAADFSEATLRALTALGNADDPGQLLLSVDYQLAHLLVDEFQDTSWTHRELIGRLTSGWQTGDGRTLFAVGDPMQSIYRFREAEVGIFLEAQASSQVAGIAVECLDLSRNFRSHAPIVGWVNIVFAQVLPPVSDPTRGEVAYKHVLATRGVGNEVGNEVEGADPPTLDILSSRQEEALAVVRSIRAAQRDGYTDIAILVQARRHLDAILPALRNEGIDYSAIELETLAQRLATRDLVSLTRVLTQPTDRLASLAVLRAPWCGLVLQDLLVVAQGADRRAVFEAIADPTIVAAMTTDGQARVAKLRANLHAALTERGRASLARRVRAAWLALGGPACGEGALDETGAQRFFALLGSHERGGDIADWDAFVAATERIFAEPARRTDSSVQVMTIHKAKGLEFDMVILPGLDRPTGHGDEPALRWKQREQRHRPALLLAPLRAREGAQSAPDPIYRYLQLLDAAEGFAERGRLLYVGCTRARRRLHLLATLNSKPATDKRPLHWQRPANSSALAQLWPAVHDSVAPPRVGLGAGPGAGPGTGTGTSAEGADVGVARANHDQQFEYEDAAVPTAQPLRRLSLAWQLPGPAISVGQGPGPRESTTPRLAFDWAHATAANVGTVAHRLLAQIAVEGLAAWQGIDVAREGARINTELAQEGVPAAERAEATQRIVTAITRTLADSRGRWLFDPAHTEAHSEWALAGFDRAILRHVTLDRTFVADGVRWIVDFKTGRHEGGDVRAFLDRERERYLAQLEGYARIVRELDPRPIRLALYFPLVADGWREWAFHE